MHTPVTTEVIGGENSDQNSRFCEMFSQRIHPISANHDAFIHKNVGLVSQVLLQVTLQQLLEVITSPWRPAVFALVADENVVLVGHGENRSKGGTNLR
jgi:hypothetical protein